MPQKLIIKGVATFILIIPNEYNMFVKCLDDYQKVYPDREVVFE